MEIKINKKNDFEFTIDKTDDMNVPCSIYASQKLIDKMKNDITFQQVKNVSCLPGIVKKSIAMSDAHQGYGFSIGGVAAFDSEKGIITPGGVGFDINCGVRLISTNLNYDNKEEKDFSIKKKIHEIIDKIYSVVPVGVGSESEFNLSHEEVDQVLINGVDWAIKKGYGSIDDKENCEEYGKMPGADPTKVTPRAKKRGRRQLGTLGAGNHFVEIQIVDEIYDNKISKIYGINKIGQVLIMIHTGSRGIGHQIASDYLRRCENKYENVMENLPEKDLVYAPINSELGKDYFAAMACAANFAWCNRHIIASNISNVLKELFPDVETKTVYDIAHNICKKEIHNVDGEEKELYVHRKGATRAFPAGREENPKHYLNVGHPVLVPGSMGTSSYVLVGTEKGLKETFGSSAHGAGRVMSRSRANKEIDGKEVKENLAKHNIFVKSPSARGIAAEAPAVYKDVDEVIKSIVEAGICKKIIKMKPFGVIKG